MPSSVIGALRVSLGLDAATFSEGATAAERRAHQMGERIGRSIRTGADTAKTALGGLAAAVTATAFADATQRAFDYADSIADLSDRTGASTKLIQEFRYAAQLSGSGLEIADEALGKFTRSLGLAQGGSDAQIKLFRALGVTSGDFDTAFRQTLDGLSKLPSVQQRNATALQLFGKSAASLTALVGQGSAGFDQLARRASELGVVLRDDVIRNAGQANDQLDTMKMILNAQFANAVAQNAGSITAMAQALGDLTGSLIKFMGSNPELALEIIGAIAGSRFGPIGAAAGVIGGYKLGRKVADNNTDPEFRRQRYDEARAALRKRQGQERRGEPGAIGIEGTTAELRAEFEKQRRLRRDARARRLGASAASEAVTVPLPVEGTGEAAAAAKAAATAAKAAAREQQQAAEKDRRDRQRATDMITRADAERISAIADLTVNVSERVAIERELNDQQRKAALDEIKRDADLTQAEKDKLVLLTEDVYGLRQNLIQRRAEEEVAREALEAAQARNQSEQDILSAQAGLARTARERGAVELKILALQFEQMRATERAVIASQTATDQQKAMARDRLGTLDQLEGYAQQRVKRDNLSPLGRYLDGIPQTATEVSEAIEGIQANGLDRLVDGIADVRGGFEGLADTVKSVADDIIRQLLRIALQKAFAAVFGAALGGGKVGDVSAGSTLLAKSLNIDGARAKGGPVVGGKNYFVGERGVEVFRAPRSGAIVANDDLNFSGGVTTVNQTINYSGAVDIADRKFVVQMAEAARLGAMRGVRDDDRRRG